MATKKGYFGWLKENNPDALSEICSKGGKTSQANGTANKWTGGPNGTAADAGRKGGSISRRKPKEQA